MEPKTETNMKARN